MTPVANHPFVILRGSWVGTAKAHLANDFLGWLQEPAQQHRFANAGFRNYRDEADTPLSTEPGIINDRALELYPPTPKTVATMSESWSTLRKAARILMILDLANASERTSVDKSVKELDGKDQVAVWTVARGEAVQLQNMTSIGGGSNLVLQAIDSAPLARGPGSLYSAISSAYASLKGGLDASHIDAVVVITAYPDDGLGERLAALEWEIRAQRGGHPVRIYAVAFQGANEDSLLGIEGASGGVASVWNDPAAAIRTSLGNF